MTGWIRNGYYQHLINIGTCGLVVCNHCDREIMLVDPWPTCHSEWIGHISSLVDPRPLNDDSRAGKTQIAQLASFLRNSVARGYNLTGILVSHMHFDHADDIILLLELLAADENNQLSRNTFIDHHSRRYQLMGNPIPADALPPIYCDYDTIFYLVTFHLHAPYTEIIRSPEQQDRYFSGNSGLREYLDAQAQNCYRSSDNRIWNHNDAISLTSWHDVQRRYTIIPGSQLVRGENNYPWYEISDGRGNRLHYDDSYNKTLDRSHRLAAGQECQAFEVGQFRIVPYVWDHMNTGANFFWLQRGQRAHDDQTAGSLQRMTAFSIRKREIQNAKRTFIIGSAGEMNRYWTRAFNNVSITTDLLIQAIVHPFPSFAASFYYQLEHCLNYMLEYITVNEALAFCHFEEFVRLIPDTSRYHSDFQASVRYTLAYMHDRIRWDRPSASQSYITLFNDNKIFALKRRGYNFEMRWPTDVFGFRSEILNSERNESISVQFDNLRYPEEYLTGRERREEDPA